MYKPFEAIQADYSHLIYSIAAEHGVTRVCEIGAGANPSMSRAFIELHSLDYVRVDKSDNELALAPAGYKTRRVDLTADGLDSGAFDLVLSRFVAEHIPAPEQFHRNVPGALSAGGRAVHLFSTLYGLPGLSIASFPSSSASRGYCACSRLARRRGRARSSQRDTAGAAGRQKVSGDASPTSDRSSTTTSNTSATRTSIAPRL